MASTGQMIAAQRRRLKLSQRDLAELLCGMSGHATLTRHEVSRWERGRRTPSRFWQDWLDRTLHADTAPPRSPLHPRVPAGDQGGDARLIRLAVQVVEELVRCKVVVVPELPASDAHAERASAPAEPSGAGSSPARPSPPQESHRPGGP